MIYNKNITLVTILSVLSFSCKTAPQFKTVTANAETEPVETLDDAADDICIWVNPDNALNSRIIGTNKKQGLVVYTLEGKALFKYNIGRVNNVDIRSDFKLGKDSVSIVTASNRSDNTIAVYKVNTPTGMLENVAKTPLVSKLNEVYGLCMYKSPKDNKIYVFVVSKSGNVEQWLLNTSDDNLINGEIVRAFSVGNQAEGMVADDTYGVIYIAEEDKALWRYSAEPDAGNKRASILSTSDVNIEGDLEGVTLYSTAKKSGYIIVSSQGNNSYAVLDRETNVYIDSFEIIDGKEIDGTNDTDGIDASAFSFGDKYPKGIFIAQDGANVKLGDTLNQNFKIVDWRSIESTLKLKN